MMRLAERSRQLAQQALLHRRAQVDDDMRRYRMASHTPAEAFNKVSRDNADRLQHELAEIDKALEELRCC